MLQNKELEIKRRREVYYSFTQVIDSEIPASGLNVLFDLCNMLDHEWEHEY